MIIQYQDGTRSKVMPDITLDPYFRAPLWELRFESKAWTPRKIIQFSTREEAIFYVRETFKSERWCEAAVDYLASLRYADNNGRVFSESQLV
jgi:hypothetical protein